MKEARLQGGQGLPIKCSCGAESCRLDQLQSNTAGSTALRIFLISDKKGAGSGAGSSVRGGGRVQLPDPEMGADVANGKWREVESIEKVEYQCLDLEICRAEYDGKGGQSEA